MNRNKALTTFFGSLLLFFLIVTPAFAHVVVKPDTAPVAAFQTFTIGVPNEKDNPVVAVKLMIPDGLQHVSPNVKPGWTIEIKKSGEGEEAKITEIDWTGGSIPVDQRDEFVFSAQVPAKETTVQWKAYQIYENGDVISWDQKPTTEEKDDDSAKSGPYSQTKIINDLAPKKANEDVKAELALKVGIAAMILSAITLGLQLRKK